MPKKQERDIREADGLVWFLYSTDRTNGGGALCQSYHKKRPIRVFRPSLLGGKYAPPFLDIEEDDDDNDVAYRYDGLYMVCAVWDVDGHETEAFPVVGQNGWQTFFFTRVPKKPLDKSKVEAGVEYNAMGTQELWGSIQKMRGVRRPKKFEIPPPPVKLPPVKRAAISGVYKDRKCPGYKRPEPVAPLKPLPPPPPPKSQPRSKSPRNVPNQDYGESDSSSESEEEERHTQSRHVAADEGDDSSDSDSDSSHKQIKHTSSTLSAGSPSKVHTPRPRLNSIAQPKKPSPAANPDDDSSDSEASLPASPAPARQTKRVRKPSPKKQLLNAMDVSAFFPKRASAAKAEAANRDMLGSQRTYNKRKASATAAAPKKPSRVSGRKKSKLQYSDSEDDSSSEEEKRDPNAIDQSILTVGSRVLVEYKGQVFKSTIRKRRFKNESRDFLIHYDGNKRTNVHWITLDRIKQILEINVDTPPKPKKKPVPPPKNNIKKGGAGNNNKRKAKEQLLRQESLQKSHYMEAKDAGAIGGASDPQSGDSDIKKVSSVESKEPSEEATPSAAKEMPEMENAKEPDNRSVSQAQSESLSSANGVIELKDSDEKKHDDEKPPSKTDVDADMDGNKEIAPVDTQEAAKALEPSSKEKASAAEEELDTEDVEDLASATTNDRPKPTSRNIKTTTAEAASTKKPRETVVTDVNVAGKSKSSENQEPIKDPLQMLAEEAGSDIDDNGSRKESDENSISSIGGSAKQEQSAIAPTSELKYPIGSNVYVEYRHIFYSSTILKTRRKRSAIEYLVHYEGYKKSSNRWVKVNALHDVNVATTQHYEEQRLIPADILYEAEQPDFSMTTRRKKTLDTSEPIASSSTASSIPSSTAQRKPPPRRMKSDASETTTQAALENLRAGVDFLPGSMVFVDWNAKLYLAKMLKKRYSGEQMEYRVSYDGFKSNHDAWVSIYKIYEVNPQSKRVFKRINSDLIGGEDKDKPKRRAPPGPRRRESRKKPQDYDEIVSHSSASSTPITRNGDNSAHSRASSRVQTSRTTSTIDMNGIDPGVEFLPGSQLFAEYDGSLCLAKMMKKRGKGDYMEYLIQYTGLKKAKEAWVSTALVYEINPQTKRMFRKLAKK
jgi:hypothetical protein